MLFFLKNKLLNCLSIFNISVGLFLVLKRLAKQNANYIEDNVPINFSIFYSTETGNSRKISELLKSLLDKLGIDSHVLEINSIFDFDVSSYKKNSVLIFVISTCGNGSFPASSRKYVRYLSKMIRSGNEIFLGTKYTIIGLGSSIYEYSFNSAANKLDKFISLLGGEKYCEIALLDEVNGNELDFKIWWKKTFLAKLGVSDFKEQSELYFSNIETRKKDNFICKLRNANEASSQINSLSGNCHISENYFKLLEFWPINRKLLCESKAIDDVDRQIFNLQLKLPDGTNYKTFDIIDILPPNDDETVIFFSNKVLGMQSIEDLKNTIVDFAPVNDILKSIKVPFPNNCSLMHVLKYYFDLMSLPTHTVILQFTPYLNKNEGEFISNKDSFNEIKDLYKFSFPLFIDKYMKSLVPIPIESFIKFNGIRQNLRSYSISSSSLCSPSTIDLTISTCIKGYVPVSLHEVNRNRGNKSNVKKYIKGLCSSFLFEFDLNLPVLGTIRSSSLNINDITSPILMFSHGSGIAPIRALLHERKYILMKDKKPKNPAYLFYGCRTENEIIYKDELEELKSMGALTEVFFALSKSQEKHVNDIISHYKNLLLEIVDRNDSIIYICGKKNFVLGIKNEIASIISDHRPKNVIRKIFAKNRIFLESWN
ncbi:nitric-oxide synthase [Cryptosporidium ubiquitum]|uniref:NADPH--hemoprotein reductase n=1 Tax=Cryptosporidium ubiquitum TaxID=857276 RepID=A0A1J4MCY5_9CRYT|nr:nitric-oxide synthase [Cryptosporidium ubiquitum]OII72098.1 nitric-oxide synthase [Cryptosporidium ubiquitum]